MTPYACGNTIYPSTILRWTDKMEENVRQNRTSQLFSAGIAAGLLTFSWGCRKIQARMLVLPNAGKERVMGFTKISNVSLTDLFVQQVENMILSGELQVGEKLPPERELAIRMASSRSEIGRAHV